MVTLGSVFRPQLPPERLHDLALEMDLRAESSLRRFGSHTAVTRRSLLWSAGISCLKPCVPQPT